MHNLNVNEKVLKFKDFENINYEVDVNDDDLVIDIKQKLSNQIKRNYKNIVLMFKNEILFDDKLISDYKIESNHFVLWLDGEDCVRYSSGNSNIIKCITIIDSFYYCQYFVNMNKCSTVQMMKSIIARKYGLIEEEFYLEFIENNLSIDENATLEQCGLRNRCRINLIHKNTVNIISISVRWQANTCHIFRVNKFCTIRELLQLIRKRIGTWYNVILIFEGTTLRDDYSLDYYGITDEGIIIAIINLYGGGCISYNALVIPLSDLYESFEITNAKCLDDLITEISAKCGIHKLIIKLYSDADKINEIRNDQELRDLYNIVFLQKQIYYEIISEFDKLEMGEFLGKGSYGEVYKCRNRNTSELFAMKIFYLSSDVSERNNLQIEIDCYLKLRSHIRIVKYENHFISKNKSYILMEYMDKGSLGSYVKHNDLLPEHKIAKYARQILEGLEYLHCNRILHRDLKGDNILLNENDDLKLCDFGLAKILTDISSGDFLNGVVQSEKGTLNFRSPEIINGEQYGSPSDIWSFGATMVEIITRKYPHQGKPYGEMLLNILAGKLIFVYPANSSNDIKSFINSCLKINPKERAKIEDLYQSSFLNSNSS